MVFCSWTSAVTFSLNYISHCSKRFRHSTYQHIFQVWPKNLLLPATAKWTDEMTRMISIGTGIDGVSLAHHKYLRWSTHILTNMKTLHSQKIYLQIEHFFWSIDNFPIDRGSSSAGVITWYKQKMADCKGGLTWATLAHEAVSQERNSFWVLLETLSFKSVCRIWQNSSRGSVFQNITLLIIHYRTQLQHVTYNNLLRKHY